MTPTEFHAALRGLGLSQHTFASLASAPTVHTINHLCLVPEMTLAQSALSLARDYFRKGDSLFRAGVQTRMYRYIHDDHTLDADSLFIKAVAAERRQEPLP